METENTLARRITGAGLCASYDEACKRLLANKQILAWILKNCTEEFRDYSIKEIVEKYIEGTPEIAEKTVHQDEKGEFVRGDNSEDTTVTEGTVFFDIRFRAVVPVTGEVISLILNVEIQNKFYPGYPVVKRGIYYGSRLISAQYGTEFTDSHYENIKKVYSIWICQKPPKYRKNTITTYTISENNVVGQVHEKKKDYDLMSIVMVCLGGAGERYEGLFKMLDVLLSEKIEPEEKKKILQEEFDIVMTKTMESEVLGMCNLSQGIWDEAWGEAWDKATVKANLESIQNLMESLDITAEKAMDALKIPTEQRELYRKALEEAVAAGV